AALVAARVARDAARLDAGDGVDIGDRWDALLQADDRVRELAARWLGAETRSAGRLDRAALADVAAPGTALRSGRSARRLQLARVGPALTRALPLWVGTLPDIDELLPLRPALFDLVILDE